MSLKVIKSGLLDTVQDTGRWGYQHVGVNVGGAMDCFSAQLANALLGKSLQSAVIELHYPAASLQFEIAVIICITGADFSPSINEVLIPLHQPVLIPPKAIIKFTRHKRGARCYLSVLQDLDIDKWMNSYSTNVKVGAGGYEGRPLQKDDNISFTISSPKLQIADHIHILPWMAEGVDTNIKEVQFIMGKEWEFLTTAQQTIFLNEHYLISVTSDRMGYRLIGEPLLVENATTLLSSAVSFGTIQLLPSGQLVVLMADSQTTGGYPRIGHVITAHLPYLAQANPNDRIRFGLTTIKTAEEKLTRQQQYLAQIQNACKFKIENWLHALH